MSSPTIKFFSETPGKRKFKWSKMTKNSTVATLVILGNTSTASSLNY